MFKISTSQVIYASPTAVWKTLMAFEDYPSWNPFILSLSGKPVVGENLTAYIQPPGGNKMKFTPIVLVSRENEEFRWKGKLLVPGLFDGEHSFRIEKRDATSVTFLHEETFTGLLVPLLKKVLAKSEQGFRLMNDALKKRVEK